MGKKENLLIDSEVLENDLEKIGEISGSELKMEISILLYEKDKISLRKADENGGLTMVRF